MLSKYNIYVIVEINRDFLDFLQAQHLRARVLYKHKS